MRNYVNEKAPLVGGLAGVTVGVHLRGGRVAEQVAALASDVGASS